MLRTHKPGDHKSRDKETLYFFVDKKYKCSVVSVLMKAAVLRAYKEPPQVEELAVEAPHAGEVAVKIIAAGVCQSDIYVLEGATPVPPPSSQATKLSA
jgi:hypothetical protein